ncbi:MAG: 50S ribosomal protein L11 methyltransferase [Bacteroidota bacterium]|nr:50S ribosomal protein L11 methyltransferase [Bacteroidota bacterium]MDP4225825.1 50S ribosomal protein L11 methyltransferase [Bacteroidota bacterium]MDP4273792.1 50S ribosomal protein L11 methyltransferase [Bacteroidota bacterium]
MDYIELNCSMPEGSLQSQEILIAELNNLGYEGFLEDETGLKAYIPASAFNFEKILWLKQEFSDFKDIQFSYLLLKEQNWNEESETRFQPIIIGNRCVIRPSTSKTDLGVEFEIIINPKMSFGTGRHETTTMIVETLLDMDLRGKSVLDMGCGTGILSILASKKQAATVTAIDNDTWAYQNCLENIKINHCSNISVLLGDAQLLKGKKFQFILANLNRNILVNDMKHYSGCSDKGTQVLMSGFLTSDLDIVIKEAAKYQFKPNFHKEKNDWVMASFTKQ